MLLKAVVVLKALIAFQGVCSQNPDIQKSINILQEITNPPIFEASQPFASRFKVYTPISIERGHELWMDRPLNDFNDQQENDDFVNEIMKALITDSYYNRHETCFVQKNETFLKDHVDVLNNNTKKYPHNFLTIFNGNTNNPDDTDYDMSICIDHIHASNVSEKVVIEMYKCIKSASK